MTAWPILSQDRRDFLRESVVARAAGKGKNHKFFRCLTSPRTLKVEMGEKRRRRREITEKTLSLWPSNQRNADPLRKQRNMCSKCILRYWIFYPLIELSYEFMSLSFLHKWKGKEEKITFVKLKTSFLSLEWWKPWLSIGLLCPHWRFFADTRWFLALSRAV